MRRAPLSPEGFSVEVRKKTFTNGADVEMVDGLFRKTATYLLGSTLTLEYKELVWSAEDYAQLGAALPYCGALEELMLINMGLGDADAAAVLRGLTSCASLRKLSLLGCTSFTALPDLSGLTSLQEISLFSCKSLTALPDLSGLASLSRAP